MLAHAITATRGAFGATAAYLLWLGRPRLALLMLVLGLATDAIDGEVARRRGTDSTFGAIWDQFHDFAIAFAGLVGLVISGNMPLYMMPLFGVVSVVCKYYEFFNKGSRVYTHLLYQLEFLNYLFIVSLLVWWYINLADLPEWPLHELQVAATAIVATLKYRHVMHHMRPPTV